MRLPLAAFDPLIVRGKEFSYWRELQRRPWNPEKRQLVLDRSPDFVIAGQALGIEVERYEDLSLCSTERGIMSPKKGRFEVWPQAPAPRS
jgi:hypothetical protein